MEFERRALTASKSNHIPIESPPAHLSFTVNPVVVLRTGGLGLNATRFPAGAALLTEANARDHATECVRLADVVCEELQGLLPAAYDHSADCGRAMLQVRRRLHNGKLPHAAQIQLIEPLLSPEQAQNLAMLIGILAMPDQAQRRHIAYQNELDAGIKASLDLANDPLLRRGIEVANSALFNRLERFERNPEEISKKDRDQLGMRLLRYALRAGRKTSPLSTLGIVTLCPSQSVSGWHPSDRALKCPAIVHHDMQVSHSALEALLNPLLSQLANLDSSTLVSLNTSLEQHAEGFAWWRIRKDDPPEIRVRRSQLDVVKSNATLLHVLYRLAKRISHEQPSIGELKAILESILPADIGQRLDSLLAELWQLNVLEPNLPLAVHPMDLARTRISSLRPASKQPMLTAFDSLHTMLTEKSRTNIATVSDIEGVFAIMLKGAGSTLSMQQFRPILIENCTTSSPKQKLGERLKNDVFPSLALIMRLAPILAVDSPMSRLRRFATAMFLEQYGAGTTVDNCLPFIREFAASIDELLHSTPEQRRNKLSTLSATDFDYAALLEHRNRLLEMLAKAASGNETTSFSEDEFDHFADISVALCTSRIISHMFFVQPCIEGERSLYVLNQMYPGAASTYTRFLEQNEDLTSLTADYMAQISENGKFWELTESFCFNASVHPHFTERRVSVPPHHVNRDNVTSIANFGIRHRPAYNDLVFVNSDKEDVSIFFSAIMSPFAMARTHQVVRALGSWVEMIEELWQPIAVRIPPDKDGIRKISRIEIGNLVIVRACIICPQAVLPSAQLPAHEFFFKLSEWAGKQNLAKHVFVRKYAPAALGDDIEEENWGKPAGKSGKPMPLDFDCPISVLSFQKDLIRTSDQIVFTEALPSPDQFVSTRNGEPVVSELGLEVTMTINRQAPGK